MEESLRSLLLQKLNTWERNLVEVVMNQYQIKLDKVQAKIDELVCKLMGLDESTPSAALTDTEFTIALGAIRLRFAREAIDENDAERSLTLILYVAETVGLATVDKEAAIKKSRSEYASANGKARHAPAQKLKDFIADEYQRIGHTAKNPRAFAIKILPQVQELAKEVGHTFPIGNAAFEFTYKTASVEAKKPKP